jgi:hypothetical protein
VHHQVDSFTSVFRNRSPTQKAAPPTARTLHHDLARRNPAQGLLQ